MPRTPRVQVLHAQPIKLRKFIQIALNEKRQRLVEEYLKDLNAIQATLRAGYSEKTARCQCQRLLKNVEVAQAIFEGMAASVDCH